MTAKRAAPKAIDLDKVMQEVALGRHDERLMELAKATGERFLAAGKEVRWRIALPNPAIDVDEDTVTLGMVERAERLTGRSWLVLDPRKSARDSAAICRAYLEHHGTEAAEAAELVAAVPVKVLVDALSEFEATRPFDPTDSQT
jgi:hypothetical protein